LLHLLVAGGRSVDDKERLKRWTCAVCGQRFVVPDLARMCEEKHN